MPKNPSGADRQDEIHACERARLSTNPARDGLRLSPPSHAQRRATQGPVGLCATFVSHHRQGEPCPSRA
jgi:hypothetical protein